MRLSSHDIGLLEIIFISIDLELLALSLTVIVRVHSSLIELPEVMAFQFRDRDTLQLAVLSSDREATSSPQM